MDTVLLLITAGLYAVSSHAERQYHVVYERKNWTEAQSYCRENYTDLATVDNMEDVTTLNNMTDRSKLVHPNGWRLAWIGLYDDVNSWRWSDGSSSSFRPWIPGQPDGVNQHCVAADFGYSGQWRDWPCDDRIAFICYSTPTSQTTSSSTAGFSTPPHYLTTSSETQPESATSQTTSSSTAGFSTPPHYLTTSSETQPESALYAVSSHAERQYHFVYERKNWTEAQSYCRENYTDLATVDNMEDVTTLNNTADTSKLVHPNGWRLAWIGLYDDVNSWRWSDGSSSSFRPWIPGQPDGVNQHCVAADFGYSGQWRDWPCDDRIAFICYSTPTSQTTSSSTAGFSTPPHYLTTSSETQPESATSQTTSSSTAGFSTPPHYLTTSSETQPESGLCAVSSHAERQYHFVYERKTWTEAQSYCRENYTDLATVDNMEDMMTLNNTADTSKLVHPNGWRGAWIGLYRGTYSWRWSLSDTSFYKHGETEFRRWRAGEPSNINSAAHCTAMDEDGLWNDTHCSNRLKVVCSYVRGSDVTFILINKSMTWTEAQSHCRVNYTDLTSVRNMTENQKVQELIPAGERVWIGLFRDSWKWSDGSSSSFRHWLPWQPENSGENQHCVAAYFDYSRFRGQWGDWFCDTRTAFICYSTSTSQTTSSSTAGFSTPPHYLTTSSETQPESATTKQVFRLRFHTQDSSLDPNDPAVMEDTLKKLKQKLKDQGLGDNIKLSWRKQPDGKVFHKEEKKKKKTKKDEL